MKSILFNILLWLVTPSAVADCIDVVDLQSELQPGFTTQGDVRISYQYNLEDDTYTLAWQKDDRSGGPFGPFHLTMSCGTPSLKWENSNFLLFESGCGTFCWYAEVFSLVSQKYSQIPGYRQIEKPLAFDPDRNLLAYYHSQNVIHVKNLITGIEQAVETAYKCDSYSGLCFTDVKFLEDKLAYTWRWKPTGENLFVTLDKRLIE